MLREELAVDFLILIAAGIGAILILATWSRPVVLTCASLLSIIFARTIAHLSGVPDLGVIDDIMTVGILARGVQARFFDPAPRTGRVRFPGFSLFLTFGLLGVISAIISDPASMSNTASGTFLALKGVLFGWAVAQLPWKNGDVRRICRAAAPLFFGIALLGLVSFAIPQAWAAVFSVNGAPIQRYGLSSALGPFIHPFDLAFVMSMTAILAFAWVCTVSASRAAVWLVSLGALTTFLSFRRKDLLGLVAAAAVLAILQRRWLMLTALALILPIVVILAFEEIQAEVVSLTSSYFTVDSREARTALTQGAVQLAHTYFPFGAGFGRFASRTAAVNYSDEYFNLGLNFVYGLGPGVGQGAFLTDTSWPAIIGETGFIGAAAFALGLLVMSHTALSWRRREPGLELYFVSTATIGWLILTIFQSTGAAVFTAPPTYPFIFSIVGIGAALASQRAVPLAGRPSNRRSRGSRPMVKNRSAPGRSS